MKWLRKDGVYKMIDNVARNDIENLQDRVNDIDNRLDSVEERFRRFDKAVAEYEKKMENENE